jgi:hypothetical protein
VWGIGRQEHRYGLSFDDLTAGSDLIVSTSVQEGFGLLFVNAPRWHVPLVARHLPILDGIGTVFDDYPVSFYRTVQVPTTTPSISSMVAYLRMRYEERIDALKTVLPDVARARLELQLDELLSSETIDFSFLAPQMQLTLLGDLADSGFATEVRALNQATIDSIRLTSASRTIDRSDAIEAVLGYRTFAETFQHVVDHIVHDVGSTDDHTPGRYETVRDVLIERYADLSYLRLILAPFERT